MVSRVSEIVIIMSMCDKRLNSKQMPVVTGQTSVPFLDCVVCISIGIGESDGFELFPGKRVGVFFSIVYKCIFYDHTGSFFHQRLCIL